MGGGASLPSDVNLTHLFTDLVKSYGFLFFFLSLTVMAELVLPALLLVLAREGGAYFAAYPESTPLYTYFNYICRYGYTAIATNIVQYSLYRYSYP